MGLFRVGEFAWQVSRRERRLKRGDRAESSHHRGLEPKQDEHGESMRGVKLVQQSAD